MEAYQYLKGLRGTGAYAGSTNVSIHKSTYGIFWFLVNQVAYKSFQCLLERAGVLFRDGNLFLTCLHLFDIFYY